MAGVILLDPKGASVFSSGVPELVLINGTNMPVSGYAFDAAAAQSIYFQLIIDGYTSGNLTLDLDWYSRAGNTTGNCKWNAQIAAVTPGDAQSLETDAFATANTTTTTVNGTARGLTRTTITISNLDSLANGDRVTLVVTRDAADAGDTLAGDAALTEVRLSYS